MTEIAAGCDLQYDVKTSTTFLFDVSVATTSRQQVVRERLRITPPGEIQAFDVGLMQNRVHRVRVEPGAVSPALRRDCADRDGGRIG